MVLWVNFSKGCGYQFSVYFSIYFEALLDDISQDKNIVFQRLREIANAYQYCGQPSINDRKHVQDYGKMVATYVASTNITKVNRGWEKVNLDGGIDILLTNSVPSRPCSAVWFGKRQS